MTLQFKSYLPEVESQMISICTSNMNKVSQMLVEAIKEKLSQPGSGRMYGGHQASAPGEPPSPYTGELRESIKSEVTVDSGRNISSTVGSDLDKAVYLELGTRTIAPRPFFKVTVLENLDKIISMLGGEK